jgi:hypothetical protein
VLGRADLGYGAASTPIDTDTTSLRHLTGKLRAVLYALQSADVAPTADQEAALAHFVQTLSATEQQWNALLNVELPKLNRELKQDGVKEVSRCSEVPQELDEGDDRDQ